MSETAFGGSDALIGQMECDMLIGQECLPLRAQICCCRLGVAPRAQMLKKSVWLQTLRHAIEVSLDVRKSNVVIFTLETAGSVGVWAVEYSYR